MKWVNHKVTTFALIYIATRDFFLSGLTASFSTVPDALEGFDFDSYKWKKRHRRVSHWLLGWVLLCALSVLQFYSSMHTLPWKVHSLEVFSVAVSRIFSSGALSKALSILALLSYSGFLFSLGSILHIIEDSLSGSVPLIHPTKRVFSIGVIKTGSFIEYLISFGLLGFALFL
ncbi:MAG: hypothetical protein ACPLSA_00135 [Caldanaerobacter sp.]